MKGLGLIRFEKIVRAAEGMNSVACFGWLERLMSKLLKKCDSLSDQRETVSEGQLGELLENLKKVQKKLTSSRTKKNNAILFKSLAVGLSLAYCCTGNPIKAGRLKKLLDKTRDKDVRAGTREVYPIVQLCIPDKESSDYERYSNAVSIAEKRDLSPTEFFQELTDRKGGMSGFIKRGSRKTNRRVSKLKA